MDPSAFRALCEAAGARGEARAFFGSRDATFDGMRVIMPACGERAGEGYWPLPAGLLREAPEAARHARKLAVGAATYLDGRGVLDLWAPTGACVPHTGQCACGCPISRVFIIHWGGRRAGVGACCIRRWESEEMNAAVRTQRALESGGGVRVGCKRCGRPKSITWKASELSGWEGGRRAVCRKCVTEVGRSPSACAAWLASLTPSAFVASLRKRCERGLRLTPKQLTAAASTRNV